MSSFPGWPAARIVPMIVHGGHHEDPAPNQSGDQRLYDPLNHGNDVDLEHTSFSSKMISSAQTGQQGFPGIMDPGTLVYVLKIAGEAGGIILGQGNSLLNTQEGSEGGQSLMGNKFNEIKNTELDVRIPPTIEETEEDGVKIRKAKEKDQKHNFGLMDGLPVHGALFEMTGFRLPEIRNVPTAKQTNDGMMTQDMMSQLPGQIMSLGQMFQGLMGKKGGGGGAGGGNYVPQVTTPPANNAMSRIQASLTPRMAAAVNSVSTLVQGMETRNGTAFLVGNVVHEPTYLKNAEVLLKQANTIEDLISTLQRLQHDETLFGHEYLNDCVFSLNTAFGVCTQTINFKGDFSVEYSSNAMNNINTFSNTVTSPISSPGIGGGGGNFGGSGSGKSGGGMNNMFGKSGQTLMDMMKRLHPEGEQSAKQLHEKVNSGQDHQKLMDVVKKTLDGGDPLDSQLFSA